MSPLKRAVILLLACTAALWAQDYIEDGQHQYSRAASTPKAAVPITEKVVFYDPRYDAAWNTNCDLMAKWFERRGFEVKGAPELAEWMGERIEQGAYGSVVVMSMGLVPDLVITPLGEDCLLRRYLDAGGRVVWTGDTALYVAQGESGPLHMLAEKGVNEVLQMTEDRTRWGGEPELTEAGKAWGLRSPGTCLRGARREEVTLSLSEDLETGSSAIWLKTISPAYPLSGFVASVFALDGKNTGALEDFYRMALYTGKPVDIPKPEKAEVRPEPFKVELTTEGAGAARRAFARGETVSVRVKLSATSSLEGDLELTLDLTPQAPPLRAYDLARLGLGQWQQQVSGYQRRAEKLSPLWSRSLTLRLAAGEEKSVGPFELNTGPVAIGDYQLSARLSRGGQVLARAADAVALCPRPRRDGIYFGVRGPRPENPYRIYDYVDELSGLRLDLESGEMKASLADALLRGGRTFVLALCTWNALLENRKKANGDDYPNPWAGGKPGLKGLAGKECRKKALRMFREQAGRVAPFPAFSGVFDANDDFSAIGGWDYNAKNLEEFKAKTGLDAPAPPEIEKGKPPQRPAGIVPDDDPWLLWNEFLCRDVAGGFNDAISRGIAQAYPDASIWPVPGGAQWPLFMIQGGQYPPMNFGKDFGFNAAGYYCYEGYWQPSLAYLYWSEVARMGNRDLPVWTMPDASNARHYLRNVAHLLLAAGNRGIVYFCYAWMGPEGRKEIRELGELLQRFGPLLRRLKPAPKQVALLVPFSEACFDTGYPLRMVYVFANLVQAHIDVAPLAEEEVASSRARVIALSAVKHLRASSAKAVERFVEKGGTVLLDRDCEVPIEGAQKLEISLGQGADRKGLNVRNCGLKSRTEAVRRALAQHVPIRWDSPEDTTVIRPFVSADGVAYAYVVQVDNHEEYDFWRKNIYEPGLFDTEPPEPKERIEQFLREHGMRNYLKDTTMTVVFDAGLLPQSGQIVDVFAGKALMPQPAGEGKLAVKVKTRRFGGTLLAFLPAPVAEVHVGAPASLKRGEKGEIRIEVRNPKGGRMRGVYSFEVTLRDPSGQVDSELSGHYAAEDGLLTLFLDPALNSKSGCWQVEARELSTGRSGSCAFEVQ